MAFELQFHAAEPLHPDGSLFWIIKTDKIIFLVLKLGGIILAYYPKEILMDASETEDDNGFKSSDEENNLFELGKILVEFWETGDLHLMTRVLL